MRIKVENHSVAGGEKSNHEETPDGDSSGVRDGRHSAGGTGGVENHAVTVHAPVATSEHQNGNNPTALGNNNGHHTSSKGGNFTPHSDTNHNTNDTQSHLRGHGHHDSRNGSRGEMNNSIESRGSSPNDQGSS